MPSNQTSHPVGETFGTVEQVDEKYVLRFERRLDHPIERVWRALTEPRELEKWMAKAEQLELEEGGKLVLQWQNEITAEQIAEYDIKGIEEPGKPRRVHGTITRLEPPRLIEYKTDVHGLLRWELREDGDGCVLEFSDTLEVPDEMRPQVLAGWHSHLDRLAAALAGRVVDPEDWSIEEWAEHRARYAATLGS
jgi:uncharacterized protein YndB with AHSA1/START domain